MIQPRAPPTLSEKTAVGWGATSIVYRAVVLDPGGFTRLNVGQSVCVKEMDGVRIDRLAAIEREVAMHKACDHRNIVRCFGCYVPDEDVSASSGSAIIATKVAILLEYCESGSLAALSGSNEQHSESDASSAISGPVTGAADSDRRRSLPEVYVRRLMRDALRGLAYLHERNIVHRDIKGANLLVAADGRCKLSDFGSAAELSGYADNQFHSVAGTWWWMAPECFDLSADRGGTAAADTWSFGATLLEVGTGRPPFAGIPGVRIPALTEEDVAGHIKMAADVYGVSPAILDVARLCLQRDPAARPTAAELLKHPFFAWSPESAGKPEAGGESVSAGGATDASRAASAESSGAGAAASLLAAVAAARATEGDARLLDGGFVHWDVDDSSEGGSSQQRETDDPNAAKLAPTVAWWYRTIGHRLECTVAELCAAMECANLTKALAPIITFPRHEGAGLTGGDPAAARVSMSDLVTFVHWFGPLEQLLKQAAALGAEGDDYANYGGGNYSYECDVAQTLWTWHTHLEWFQPLCDRKTAERHLGARERGSFVIRFSTQWRESPGSFTLSFMGDRGVTHHRILRPPGSWCFAIQAAACVPTLYFDALEDLVTHYKAHPLHNARGDKSYLLVSSY